MRDVQLRQVGRASMDFAGTLARRDVALNRIVDSRLRKTLSDEEIAEDYDERLTQLNSLLKNDALHSAATLANDWLSRRHGGICQAAFEEIADDYCEQLTQLQDGPATLTTKPNFEVPTYHSRQWFHNTSGGWDGHPYMGAIQAEFVHRRYVPAKYGTGLRQLRFDVLEKLPETMFDNILEMGTSAGYYTEQLARRFPAANIVGCDVSQRMLEQAQRLGNEQGHAWQLWLAAAENTGLADNSFDLVTSYAMFHEIPTSAAAAVWKEAMRVVKPGGWIFMVDGVAELSAIDKVAGWRSLFNWERGGEPYAREYCTTDDRDLARDAGFVDVSKGLFSDRPFPRYTLARKPG